MSPVIFTGSLAKALKQGKDKKVEPAKKTAGAAKAKEHRKAPAPGKRHR